MRAAVHFYMIKVVSDALLENDDPVATITTFESNYVGKESNRAKENEMLTGSR